MQMDVTESNVLKQQLNDSQILKAISLTCFYWSVSKEIQ